MQSNKEPRVQRGQCCFCGRDIEEKELDPCRISVTVKSGKWQALWFCHAECFREKLVDPMLKPVNLS
jgi:hypothetical protein